MQQVVNPYPIFLGLDGLAVEDGYIYIGTENLDPETNAISVYWDENATQPATQPIRTIAGYPSNAGTPGQLWVSATAYSIRVRDSQSAQVFYAQSATGLSGGTTTASGQDYFIHAQYLAVTPSAQQLVCVHLFGVAVSLPADLSGKVWGYVGTAPSADCAFSMRVNGVEFGTLTVSSTGTITVSSTQQDFAVGDRFSLRTPDAGTDLVDFAATILGVTS